MSIRVNSSRSNGVQLPSNDNLNNILTSTNFFEYQPFGISFKCSRRQPNSNNPNAIYINQDIFNVFIKAIQGQSHEDMLGNPGSCQVGEKRHCGNTRGHLWECRCEDLNRKISHFRRLQFENDVILSIVKSQKIVNAKKYGSSFQFNLAIFCSGGLLGEEILLFRLFDQLRSQGVSGTINLFLIDWEYKNAITNRNPDQLVAQFLTEICGCLPPSIKVNGTFFGDAADYIRMAKVDGQFKHDLLIGADLEGAEKLMGEISQHASIAREQKPIVLVKNGNKQGAPSVCRINLLGEHEDCYQPTPPQTRPNVQAHNQSFPWELVAGGSAIVLVIAALAILGSANRVNR